MKLPLRHPIMQRITTVILDLDNTLFDSADVWRQSFNALLDELVATSGVDRETLLSDFKTMFAQHETAERAFAIEDLPSLQAKHPGEIIARVYDSAVQAYHSARKRHSALYEGVSEALLSLKDRGCLLIGYTESRDYYLNDRMRQLGLDRMLDYLYSPPDDDSFDEPERGEPRTHRRDEYRLRRTARRYLPKGLLKPDPEVLLRILREVSVSPQEAVYVGDSLTQDIAMAQEARVADVWAKCGVAPSGPEHELVGRFAPWAASVVEQESEPDANQIKPSLTLTDSLQEILPAFAFDLYVSLTTDRIRAIVDAWRTSVDVQKHFNELEMKVRNSSLTVLGAILAGAVFSIREHVEVGISGTHISLATFVLLAGATVWAGFHLMERHWYHKLLLGSVAHGLSIERRYHLVLPELGLATAVEASSSTAVGRRNFRSSHKIDLFYGGGLVLLICGALVSAFVIAKRQVLNEAPPRAAAGVEPSPAPISGAAPTVEPASTSDGGKR